MAQSFQRKIAHVDMDAFYVSVEMRDNPQLRGKPVAVGGRSDRRGVLSTCNYLARQFGVSSAMPTAMALKKCPDLIVVPGRMDVYKGVSKVIREIFTQYTSVIEPLSLDEAFLDLSECDLYAGSATLIAQQIRDDIFRETSLTASAGIAPLKFLAKIASDLNKPNGQYTISPADIDAFLLSLPLSKIPGVGKVTTEKLARLGFTTCGDVRRASEAQMINHFGKYGRVLWDRSHGIDERAIQVSRVRKSVGVERTLEQNISQLHELQHIVDQKLLPELEQRAAPYLSSRGMNKIGVKIKFEDFKQTTKEQATTSLHKELIAPLLKEAMSRGYGKSIRLVGLFIGLCDKAPTGSQLDFDF